MNRRIALSVAVMDLLVESMIDAPVTKEGADHFLEFKGSRPPKTKNRSRDRFRRQGRG